jgi:flavin reductase (DIM6/NTAB) family NADH-FMN oxidoreductase RutF
MDPRSASAGAFDRTISSLDVDVPLFRSTLRQLAGAVGVITAGFGETRAGLTATSVTSFSAEPPLLYWRGAYERLAKSAQGGDGI